jgi:hypothetical protein
MFMKNKIIIISILAVLVVAGCSQPRQPVTEIQVPGHGTEIYVFSNDVYEALKVTSNDPDGIKLIGNTFEHMDIVFNGSSEQDNAYFRVVLVNMLAKVPLYFSYEGRLVTFTPYYFIDDKWYDSANETAKPDFKDTVIWLNGPNTGALDTSVNLEGNTIYLSGTSYKNLTLAGDKLTLLLFNIDQI